MDAAASGAATSPTNSLPEPTDAQKDVGNYQKGHVRLHGLDISIENPRGTKRRPEWPPLTHHYGYIRGTVGKDKDHVDIFLMPNAEDASRPVFVVDQVKPATGAFDEHKVILGAATEAEARQAYLENYEQGWQGLGAITSMPLGEFKDWALDPVKTRKPLSLKAAPAAQKSFKVEITDGSGWGSNAQRFATAAEAKSAGDELMSRWMGAKDMRVVPSDEPVSHEWKDGQAHRVEEKPAAPPAPRPPAETSRPEPPVDQQARGARWQRLAMVLDIDGTWETGAMDDDSPIGRLHTENTDLLADYHERSIAGEKDIAYDFSDDLIQADERANLDEDERGDASTVVVALEDIRLDTKVGPKEYLQFVRDVARIANRIGTTRQSPLFSDAEKPTKEEILVAALESNRLPVPEGLRPEAPAPAGGGQAEVPARREGALGRDRGEEGLQRRVCRLQGRGGEDRQAYRGQGRAAQGQVPREPV